MRAQNRLSKLVRRAAAVCTAVLFTFSIVFSHSASAEKTRTIRVGYPIQEGLTEVNDNGQYRGYTYEYLMEISQYTGWNYEFVQIEGDADTQIITLMEMLENGEIDVMGGMVYSDSMTEQYDYCSLNYGISSYVLCAPQKNTDITSTNYTTFKKLKVGVGSPSKKENLKLTQFGEANGIEIEQVFFNSEEAGVEAADKGEVDLILAKDINIPSNELKVIARFYPQPFYFVTDKGDRQTISELDAAIASIGAASPYYEASLRQKYFNVSSSSFYLSDGEKRYIASAPVLKVAMISEKAPIQYRNKKTGEFRGVSRDMLDYISKKTGLKFEYIFLDSEKDTAAQLQEKKADLIAGVASNYNLAQVLGYGISSPYLRSPVSLVVNESISPSDLTGKRLALPRDIDYDVEYEGNVTYFNSIPECMEAIHNGTMDYGYINNYSVDYYQSSKKYKNLVTISQSEERTQNFSFGIMKPLKVELMSILNKAIESISSSELQTILYENAYEEEQVTLVSYVRDNPIQAALILLAAALTLTILFLLRKRRIDKKNALLKRVENERYEQLCELSNEILYQYDIGRDYLRFPRNKSGFLGQKNEFPALSAELAGANAPQEGDDRLLSWIAQAKEGSVEQLFELSDGSRRWLRVISKNITDKNGKTLYSIGKIMDIQEEKENQEQLREQAQKDSLTKIYNAASSQAQIISLLGEMREGEHGALFIVDVDRFKQINDNYGHYTGDRVLLKVAGAITSVFRKEDVIGRLGGDEFIIYMKNAGSRQTVADKCKNLKETIKKVTAEENIGAVSVSIGAAVSRSHQEYMELYKTADHALYEVKGRGRDGFEIREMDQE